MIAAIFLSILGLYLVCGLLFAIPFVIAGVTKIDPHAAGAGCGFHLFIIPGTMAFWPMLARRWITGVSHPPEEHNAHRWAARKEVP